MENLWTKIWENKEWVFSGIGVVIISIIGGIFFKKRNNNKTVSSSGNGQHYVAETINIQQSSGLSVMDVKELAKSVFMENFPVLQQVAKEAAEKNRDLFIAELDKNIQNKLNNEELNRFNKPDIQFALKDAIITASRNDDIEKRKILSNLIVDRIKNDGIDFKEIVYNEAINTISRLTKNHLDILTFTFITSYARYVNIKSFDNFISILEKDVLPFSNFSESQAQFQHLEYSDCGNLTIGSRKLSGIYKESYTNLFLKTDAPFISKEEYENWDLQNDLKPLFFIKFNDNDDKYLFVHKTTEDFNAQRKILLKSGVKNFNSLSNRLFDFVMSDIEIEQTLINKIPFGKNLVSKYEETSVSKLTLTSVGIVIAASHYETTVGEKLNIDIWIN